MVRTRGLQTLGWWIGMIEALVVAKKVRTGGSTGSTGRTEVE